MTDATPLGAVTVVQPAGPRRAGARRHHRTRSIGPCSPPPAVPACPARPHDQDHADRRDASRRVGSGGERRHRGELARRRGRSSRRSASSALVAVGLAGIVSVSALGVLSIGPARSERPRQARRSRNRRSSTTAPARWSSGGSRTSAGASSPYADIPTLVLDATTTAEDRSFWDNAGIDPAALISAVAENASGVSERGASTITQQLVRARLLPEDVVTGSDRYMRKAKEIIQALRLTDEYPGAAGKERVISAYLNEIYYGHEAYGIAAAADVYFGVTDLSELTVAQAALLAGLPKAPSTLDPYRYAVQGRGRPTRRAPSTPSRSSDATGSSRVSRPPGAGPSSRRPRCRPPWTSRSCWPGSDRSASLAGSSRGRSAASCWRSWGRTPTWNGVATGSTTTLDWKAQRLAERWLGAAAISPNISRKKSAAMLKDAQDQERRSALDHGVARQGPAQRGARRPRLPDRRRARLRGQCRLRPRRPREQALRAQVRRGRRWRAPARLGVQADPVRGRVQGEALEPRQPPARRDDRVRHGARTGPRATPTSASAARSSSGGRSSTPSTSRPSARSTASATNAWPTPPRPWASGSRAVERPSSSRAWRARSGTVEVRPIDLTSAYGTIANGGVRVPPG